MLDYTEATGQGTVTTLSPGGGAATTIAFGPAFPGPSFPNSIAVDDTSVYWNDFEAATVMKIAK